MKKYFGVVIAIAAVVGAILFFVLGWHFNYLGNPTFNISGINPHYSTSSKNSTNTVTVSAAGGTDISNLEIRAHSTNPDVAILEDGGLTSTVSHIYSLKILGEGDSKISFEADGYDTYSKDITVGDYKFDKISDQTVSMIDGKGSINIEVKSDGKNVSEFNATSKDEKIVKASSSGSTITLEGISTGSTTISVTKDEYTTINFNVTVTDKKTPKTFDAFGDQIIDIHTSNTASVDIKSGGAAVTGASVSSDNNKITASVDGSSITITAGDDVTAGDSAKITVTLAGYTSATFKVTIADSTPVNKTFDAFGDQTIDIHTSKTASVDIKSGGVAVTGASELSDNNKITASVEGSSITITAGDDVTAGDSATITVTLTGYTSASFKVTIADSTPANKTFDAFVDQTIIIGTPTSLTITSGSTDLTDLEINSVSNNISVATVKIDKTNLVITGVATGSTTITISAKGYNDLTINVTVNAASNLSITFQK